MIGGNTIAEIQISTSEKNFIGEMIDSWTTVQSISGWLDFSTGSSDYSSYDTKVQDSTHIFISDYKVLNTSIKAENSRMKIANKVYDILVIDDPMNLHQQLEFYLKYTGGQ